jgi:hypothetical protein
MPLAPIRDPLGVRPPTGARRFAPAGPLRAALAFALIAGCSAPEQSSTTSESTTAGSSTAESSTSESPTTTTSSPIDPTALRNVDVTVIYPLPLADELESLLAPTDPGNDGQLLPQAIFAAGGVPELDERAPLADDAARLAALRVVAVRFDPCPGELAPPPPGTVCQPDIRLIYQSLTPGPSGMLARDGALHA